MNEGILNSAVVKAKTAAALAAGVPQTEVAKQHGVTPSAISQFKQRNIELIQRLQLEFIEKALPDAQRTARRLIKQYSHPKARAKLSADIRQHAHQHTMEMLKAAGLYPGNTSVSIDKLSIEDHSQTLNINGIPEDKLFERLMKLR